MEKVRFSVEVAVGKKSGEKYAALVADLGYCKKYLSFSRQDIAELLGISVYELMDYPAGKVINLGE